MWKNHVRTNNVVWHFCSDKLWSALLAPVPINFGPPCLRQPTKNSHSLHIHMASLFYIHHYHPHSRFLRRWNCGLGNALVRMSASCSWVEMYWTFIFRSSPFGPGTVQDRKWWYWIAICFVRGRSFGNFASSIAPALSSNSWHRICGCWASNSTPLFRNSSSIFIR